ncbi:MAG TPA: FAD-dependent oxidoreductase [Paraburkholderia sp.]|uniref:flavin monoamine oxidase family protein n=1 Tax=Paraburkholderia sp. TaxID=1926495 RepID=UPI002B4A36B5|nr:FAD-dependent oxidoreductase [Paraburkholderia sp.]HKR42078.1 FAD-dependent oxidoreductase [Paraburkholderia sp.]
MQAARIGIVGAGLSGLYAAYLLEQKGISDYILLEGRDILGGRIVSVSPSEHLAPGTASTADAINRFDLGPSWFWPGYQRQLDRLVHDLGLERFEQHEDGDMVVERSPQEPPARMRGYVNSPASMRLVGGMGALVDALRRRLDVTRIITGQTVRHLRGTSQHVEVDSENASGHVTTWRVEHVLLAMPPRLVEDSIEFSPALPQALARQWRATGTWMAPHAKYFAVYDTPFWREQGLSGEARSARGPLGEIHDASMPGGSAALFGFFGVPARVRKSVSENELRGHCRAQFTRVFGPLAATPKAEFIKDWALDSYTATAADLDGASHHAEAPAATAASGPWSGRLTGIGSEWSRQFPGYVAGAIEAASFGVQALPVFAAREDDLSASHIPSGARP